MVQNKTLLSSDPVAWGQTVEACMGLGGDLLCALEKTFLENIVRKWRQELLSSVHLKKIQFLALLLIQPV